MWCKRELSGVHIFDDWYMVADVVLVNSYVYWFVMLVD